MLADPYTAWGVEHEHIRPNVARLSLGFALAAFVAGGAAGALILHDPAGRNGCGTVGVGVVIAFLAGTAGARALWIVFWVLW